MVKYYLVLDQGGQSSRCALVSESGEIVDQVSEQVSTHSEGERVEQSASEVLNSLQNCLDQLLVRNNPTAIDSAALVTQRSSVVAWDQATGEPLSPILSWQDTRARDELEAMNLDSAWIREITGLYPNPHFGASKISWLLKQFHDASHNLKVTPLQSYLAFNLFGHAEALVDANNASRTMLMDFKSQQWSAEILDRFSIPAKVLPQIQSNASDWGFIESQGARVPVRYCGGDQGAALGLMLSLGRDVAVGNVGTGAFVAVPLTDPATCPEKLLCSQVYSMAREVEYIAEGTVNGAAAALRFLETSMGRVKEFGELDETGIPVFINTIGGLGSPFWSSGLEPGFIGKGATAEAKWRAGLESIAFLIVTNLQQLEAVQQIKQLIVAGGLSANQELCQILADCLQLPVLRLAEVEMTVLGAAWQLAGRPDWEFSFETFDSGRNQELAKRFSRWQAEMHRLLQSQA